MSETERADTAMNQVQQMTGPMEASHTRNDDALVLPSSDTLAPRPSVFPNVEHWLPYNVAMFSHAAQDSILQSIVDFMQNRPHTLESLPGIIDSPPMFPEIVISPIEARNGMGGDPFETLGIPPRKERKPRDPSGTAKEKKAPRDPTVAKRGPRPNVVEIDPESPVAKTAAPAAHALKQEEDSYEEPLKKFARQDQFQGNLPSGWRVEVVMRSKGKFRGKKADKYWYHPSGLRFKSFAAVQEYLATHPEEMNTVEDKTPIVYRVSNRVRRDVPEHESRAKKRKVDDASLDSQNGGDQQQMPLPLSDLQDSSQHNAEGEDSESTKPPNKRTRRGSAPALLSPATAADIAAQLQQAANSVNFGEVGLPPSRVIISISDSRSRAGEEGLLEYKTTWSDGSESWEIATAFYDDTTQNFHPVYLDFLTRSAVSDVQQATTTAANGTRL